jgi:hypothetical protein
MSSIFVKYGVLSSVNIPPINPILFEATATTYEENTPFVVGFNSTGTVTENYTDGLGSLSTRLNVTGITGVSEVAWVTDVLVNLTGYSSLKISWRQVGDANNNNASRLVVSTNKTADSTTFDARIANANTFTLQTDTLDISGLSGKYYIRVHARDNSASVSINSDLIVYKIWLE